MEEDREASNLGGSQPAEIAEDINGDADAVEKKPKRRFIGRKAAEAKAAARAEQNGGTIEDSGAVQGAAHHYTHPPGDSTLTAKQSHLAAALHAP